jgi:hypothetical protein
LPSGPDRAAVIDAFRFSIEPDVHPDIKSWDLPPNEGRSANPSEWTGRLSVGASPT